MTPIRLALVPVLVVAAVVVVLHAADRYDHYSGWYQRARDPQPAWTPAWR